MFDETVQMGLAERYPIPYFSYSQLNTFRQCPHSYKLTYLSGKFEKRGNKYTELGSILHDIFELQGKDLIVESDSFTLQKATKEFNRNFMALKDDPRTKGYFSDKEDFIKMYQKGMSAVRNYFEMYEGVKPLYVERKFQKPIAKGLPPAKSYIDRIDGDPSDASTWVITDYKTGSSPKAKKYLRNDFQMGLYCAQVFAEFGEYPKAVQFVHPVPQKTQTAIHQGEGNYRFKGQREPVVEFSVAETIQLVRQTIAEIVVAIENDNFPLVRDSWSCRMCFHFQDGSCKPFDKQEEGWANI